jgi:hypothetical protein
MLYPTWGELFSPTPLSPVGLPGKLYNLPFHGLTIAVGIITCWPVRLPRLVDDPSGILGRLEHVEEMLDAMLGTGTFSVFFDHNMLIGQLVSGDAAPSISTDGRIVVRRSHGNVNGYVGGALSATMYTDAVEPAFVILQDHEFPVWTVTAFYDFPARGDVRPRRVVGYLFAVEIDPTERMNGSRPR